MQRLSSSMTFFHKRLLPVIWFGFLAVWTFMWFGGPAQALQTPQPERWMGVVVPVFMCVVGGFFFKRLVLSLVDEVWLDGDTLVVKSRGESTRLALSEVINVNSVPMMNPPRITLTLRTESSRLGREVSFIPAGVRVFAAFRSNPIADDLIRRIDALRRRPA